MFRAQVQMSKKWIELLRMCGCESSENSKKDEKIFRESRAGDHDEPCQPVGDYKGASRHAYSLTLGRFWP